MLEQLKTFMQVASAVSEIPRQKAERLARSLSGLSAGETLRSTQIAALAEEIMKKSQQNAQMIQTLISSEIRRQVKSLGLVTRDDLDRVNRKVFGLATKDDIDRLSKKVAEVQAASAARASAPTTGGSRKASPVGAKSPKPKAKPKAAVKPKAT